MTDAHQLRPDARNANKGTDRGRALVRDSLQRLGAGRSVVVDRADVVISGNQTVGEAQALGIPIRIIDTDGDRLIVVQRQDLDLATDPAARELAIADNRASELGLDWDYTRLAQDLINEDLPLDLHPFWTPAELAAILRAEAKAGATDPDDAPPPQPEAITQPGDLILLGDHRLLCGDARDPAAVELALAGEPADLVWTDPPYGVSVVGRTADQLTMQNDSLSQEELAAFLLAAFTAANDHCRPGAVWYVAAPGGPLYLTFAQVLHDLGIWRQMINWIKDVMVMGHNDYHYKHEHVFYGWTPGAAHYFVGDRTQDSCWVIPRPKRSTEHPTMKPVELVRRALRNSTLPQDRVLDPFGGSGTTLIACEQLDRRASLIELDPIYCDVIVRRFEAFSGQQAQRPR